MQDHQNFLSECEDLIKNNQLKKALDVFLEHVLEGEGKTQAIHQSSRLKDIEKRNKNGLVSNDEYILEKNKVRDAVLQLIHDQKNVSQVGTSGIRKLLTQPPVNPEVFIEREEDLQAIHDHFFESEKAGSILLLVNGEGGIGKTSVASRYFHIYGEKYQHMAWVFIGDSIAASLLSVADALQLRFPQEYTQEQRYQAFLQWIWALKTPILLVLDNANAREDLSDQYRELRKSPNLHILITSRVTSLSNIPVHSIKAFDNGQAYQLFTRYYDDIQLEEKELLYTIFQAVGHNTLVIELLAKNLKKLNQNKKRYRLEDLLDDLQNRNLLSLSKSRKVTSDYVLTQQTPEAIIGGMYEILHLTDKQKKLLAIFSVLPAEAIPFSRLEAMIPDMEALEEDLEALVEEGWLEEDKANYKISPVIQEVVRKKHENIYKDCKGLISGLIDLLDYETGTGHFINCSYKEAAEIIPLAQEAIKRIQTVDNNLSILVERVGNYYKTTGNLPLALGYFEDRSRIGKELYESYPENVSFKNGLAISYEKLGETHSSLGNLEKALGYFEDRSRIGKELYESYPENVSFKNGLAISYEKLGETHSSLGNLEKALGYFEDRSRIGKELYESYPENVSFKNGLAISYAKLAQLSQQQGDISSARLWFEKAQILWEELVREFPAYVQFQRFLSKVKEILASL